MTAISNKTHSCRSVKIIWMLKNPHLQHCSNSGPEHKIQGSPRLYVIIISCVATLFLTSQGNSCTGHLAQIVTRLYKILVNYPTFQDSVRKTLKNAEYLTFGFRNKKPNAECSKDVFLKFI